MKSRRLQLAQLLPGLIAILVLVGCGQKGPKMAKVVGTVTVNGEPVAKANVVFAPESGQRVASGGTDDEGNFELGTFAIDDGAIVGKHRVTIIARGPLRLPPEGTPGRGMPGGPTFPGLPLIAERYFDAGTSDLTADVEDRRVNEINFDLEAE